MQKLNYILNNSVNEDCIEKSKYWKRSSANKNMK